MTWSGARVPQRLTQLHTYSTVSFGYNYAGNLVASDIGTEASSVTFTCPAASAATCAFCGTRNGAFGSLGPFCSNSQGCGPGQGFSNSTCSCTGTQVRDVRHELQTPKANTCLVVWQMPTVQPTTPPSRVGV
jgi:hypothetical protein